jgi:DNA-binding transcriptional MerR regulator
MDRTTPHEARYTVADLARHVGVTVRTIKRWQVAGIVPPPALRNDQGWGLWTAQQAQEVLAMRLRRLR